MSIAEIFEQDRHESAKMYGVVTGVVTNNQDPEGIGRVKVKIPRISSDDESYWARVVTPMAGAEKGFFFLPEVDDEVLVAFECGDPARPYIIGSLWNGVNKPPLTNDDGKNDIRLIKTRSGHIIRLTDKDGEEKIEIIDKSEANSIVFDTAKNTITITADKDIVLSAANGKVKIDAKDVEIKASAGVKIAAGSELKAEASGTMTLKGATVNIN